MKLSDPDIEVKILRPQEIPTYVQEGFYDIGITGNDWILEAKANVHVLLDLEIGRVKQIIAVPISFPYNNIDEMIAGYLQSISLPHHTISTQVPPTKNTLEMQIP